MSDAKKYYCFCSSNCKYETMTKEQILAAIAQAVETGVVSDVDTGFITKVKETNKGGYVTFWVGTSAQYNALREKAEDCLYILTDATTQADIEKAIAELQEAVDNYEQDKPVSVNIAVGLTVNEGALAETISDVVVRNTHKYCRGIGVVFYNIAVMVTGTMAAGDSIQIDHTGSYEPSGAQYGYYPVTADRKFTAEYWSIGTIKNITITAAEDITEDCVIHLSGWYFCNGE